MKWEELIQDTAWVIDDLLTSEECSYFLHRASNAGIEERTVNDGDVRNRNSVTIFFDDESMSQLIYERIKHHLPQEVWVDTDCNNLGLRKNKEVLYGKWTPYGLNYRWRVAKYSDKGHFGPHRDGCYVVDEHHRSLITINGYLKDRPLGYGGATRFVRDDIDLYQDPNNGIFTTKESDVLYRVEEDKAGKAVAFFHDLMHDGEPLKEGSAEKWIFRTEVMYQRDPETAPKLSSQQIEARKFLAEAQEAEINCNIPDAIQLYKKAYRLDPTLDCGLVT